jgi:uncharacterized tellurite resistance protein B-like protein
MKSRITNPLRSVIDKIVGEKSRTSPDQRQRALDSSLTVMSLVAAADGNIDESEVLAVQELYASYGGGMVAAATVRKSFEIVVNDQAVAWRQLEMARSLEIELREQIFAAALQAASADSELHDDESSLLARIGMALDIPPHRVQALVDNGK